MLSFFDQKKKKCICASVAHGLPVYFFFRKVLYENLIVGALRPVAKCLNYRRFDMHTQFKTNLCTPEIGPKMFQEKQIYIYDENDQNCVFFFT